MVQSNRRFSVAETPTQRNFLLPAHQRARSHSQSSTSSTLRQRFSFLSLTPSPKANGFAHLIETPDEQDYNPVYIFDQLCSPTAVTTKFIVPPTLSKAKSLFTFRFAMPSWSMSSKSSSSSVPSVKSSKSNMQYRPYMPQPFFNAVAEYQLINGGRERDAIKAILRERGLNMTPEEAEEVFGNETVGARGHTSVHSGVYRDSQGRVWMDRDEELEYTKLIHPGSDDDSSSADGESLYYASSASSSSQCPPTGARRRPTPLKLDAPSPYGFEDSFCPTTPSSTAASYRSSVASSTMYASSGTSSTKSSKSGGGVKGIFKLGRK